MVKEVQSESQKDFAGVLLVKNCSVDSIFHLFNLYSLVLLDVVYKVIEVFLERGISSVLIIDCGLPLLLQI